MEGQGSEGGVVWIGEVVDFCVETVAAGDVIVDSGSVYEALVVFTCEEWVGEVAEELLEDAGYRVDVVIEGFWVSEVDFGGVWREG